MKTIRVMYYRDQDLVRDEAVEGPWQDVTPGTNSEVVSKAILEYAKERQQQNP